MIFLKKKKKKKKNVSTRQSNTIVRVCRCLCRVSWLWWQLRSCLAASARETLRRQRCQIQIWKNKIITPHFYNKIAMNTSTDSPFTDLCHLLVDLHRVSRIAQLFEFNVGLLVTLNAQNNKNKNKNKNKTTTLTCSAHKHWATNGIILTGLYLSRHGSYAFSSAAVRHRSRLASPLIAPQSYDQTHTQQ